MMPALPISWHFVPDQGLHICFNPSPRATASSTQELVLGCTARLDASSRIERLTIPCDRPLQVVCRYDREVDCLCIDLTGQPSTSTHACFNDRLVFDCVGDKIGAIEVLFVSRTCCWEQ
jgi:hypothetical protein